MVWCPQLESRGISLEKVSYRNIVIHHTKQGCFGRLTVRATCCTRNFFKKPCAIGEILIFYMFWAGFVWGLYGGGLTGKCRSFVRDLSFWPALHTPQQFSPFAQTTDHLLCAFWTAGFMARPPHTCTGSALCILIFQVPNRTISCIFKWSTRLYGDCMQPDHMAKYSLPMPTDLTENLI